MVSDQSVSLTFDRKKIPLKTTTRNTIDTLENMKLEKKSLFSFSALKSYKTILRLIFCHEIIRVFKYCTNLKLKRKTKDK